MLYYLKQILLSLFVTAASFVFDFYFYYLTSIDQIIDRLMKMDAFTKQYFILVFILVISLRFTYDLLPVKRFYFPVLFTLIALFSPLPRLFKILITLYSISLYISYETIDSIKGKTGRV